MFELKPLSREAVPAALEKAYRYRFLNEPMEAESICRDILEVDPGNQEAIVTLLLAMTDQFDERPPCFEQARELLTQIQDEYTRTYHAGIVRERKAKAQFRRGGPRAGHSAYEGLRQAMEHFEKAAEIRPPGNDDALLRWNTCARILMNHPEMVPDSEERFRPWLE
jgi:tetratricopeptide (TPR) repeat protein